jgi:hypothetical protein
MLRNEIAHADEGAKTPTRKTSCQYARIRPLRGDHLQADQLFHESPRRVLIRQRNDENEVLEKPFTCAVASVGREELLLRGYTREAHLES